LRLPAPAFTDHMAVNFDCFFCCQLFAKTAASALLFLAALTGLATLFALLLAAFPFLTIALFLTTVRVRLAPADIPVTAAMVLSTANDGDFFFMRLRKRILSSLLSQISARI
jgi:hypothetical protein